MIPGPLRHPVPVLAIRKARPQDDTILRQVDAATWTADVSPGPAPPVGTAFFSDQTRPDDVLVAEVEGVVVGYTHDRAHHMRHELEFQEDVGSHPRTSLRSASGGREPSSRSIGQVRVASHSS